MSSQVLRETVILAAGFLVLLAVVGCFVMAQLWELKHQDEREPTDGLIGVIAGFLVGFRR